jgi:hypothetical protein
MQQDTPKDTTAWTARFSTVDFECELPPGVRAELLRPRRAKMLGRPPSPPQKPPQVDSVRSWRHLSPWLQSILTLVGMIFVPIFLVTVVWAILAVLSPRPAAPTKPAAPVAQPTPAVLPPDCSADWNADGTASGRAGVIPEVRRAELVPVTVRRAEFIHPARPGRLPSALPVQERETPTVVHMPDGQLTTVRFCGTVNTFADLPKNPQLGDSYSVLEDVGRNSWVWYQPLGFSHAAWVDP